jgi:hypothetical protein
MSLERKEKSDSAERERIKELTKNGEEKKEWRKKRIEMRVLREKQKKNKWVFMLKKNKTKSDFYSNLLMFVFLYKKAYLMLTNLIILFLVFLVLCYRNLKMYFLEKFLVDCHS